MYTDFDLGGWGAFDAFIGLMAFKAFMTFILIVDNPVQFGVQLGRC